MSLQRSSQREVASKTSINATHHGRAKAERGKEGERSQVPLAIRRYRRAERYRTRNNSSYHELVDIWLVLHLIRVDVLEVFNTPGRSCAVYESFIAW